MHNGANLFSYKWLLSNLPDAVRWNAGNLAAASATSQSANIPQVPGCNMQTALMHIIYIKRKAEGSARKFLELKCKEKCFIDRKHTKYKDQHIYMQ